MHSGSGGGPKVYTVRKAKAKLSQLLDEVASGRDVTIQRDGSKPGRFTIACRTEAAEPKTIGFGSMKGMIAMPTLQEWEQLDREIEQDIVDGIEEDAHLFR